MVAQSSLRRLRRRLVLAVALSLLAAVLTLIEVEPAAANSSDEQAMLALINRDRAAAGAPPLVFDPALAATARSWSSTMSVSGLRHNNSSAIQADIARVEPRWTRWAENVGFGGSVQIVHNGFMNSTRHRTNTLAPDFNRVGIGVVRSGRTLWVTVRLLRGPSIAAPTCTSQPVLAAVAADLNGDGKDDLVVNRSGACDTVYLASGSRFAARSVPINGTYVPVPGNFDGKGGDNILWYAPGPATDHLWTWSGSSFTSTRQTINGHYRPYPGDFDGDGRDDILWYAPGPAPDYIWYGTATLGRFVSRPLVVNGHYQVVITDLDGDGRDDVLWYAPGAAPDYIHYSTGRGTHISVRLTINGHYQAMGGDFDGDGRGDVLWYAPGPAQDHVWYGHGRRGAFQSRRITINGTYRGIPGDFNGDGRSDVLWLGSDAVGSPLWLGRQSRGSFGYSAFRT